jgi:protein-S-isoprenylcysteine O-methyltransferase Ste14
VDPRDGWVRSLRRPGDTAWFLAGYGGVAGFFGVEALGRRGGARLEDSADDRLTTVAILTACLLAATVAPPLRRATPGTLPAAARPLGVVLQASGLGVRVWAMGTLGRAYSRTLRVEEDQGVVDTGPYRLVRHPGYAGSLLVWAGFALSSASPAVVALVAGLMGVTYVRRIVAEEALLRRELPGYATYAEGTKRLIPAVW